MMFMWNIFLSIFFFHLVNTLLILSFLEKNVEKCTITVKYIPLSQETASRVYEFDTTTTSKRINERSQEQLFDIKFLIILSCKHS
jgi:hypothetical protein